MANILVVEDDELLNEAYELILKDAGHQVQTAFNGQEALEVFSKHKPEIVLLDLRMPKMSGVQFLKKLKPAKNFPEIKIIVFSNYDDHLEVDEAMKNGATEYVLKATSSPAELKKLINRTVGEK